MTLEINLLTSTPFADVDTVSHSVDVRPAFTLYRNFSVAGTHGRAINLPRLLGAEKSPFISVYHCKRNDIQFYRVNYVPAEAGSLNVG